MENKISQSDLFSLLTYSLRYVMGRRTYAVNDVIAILDRHFAALTMAEQKFLIGEVLFELEVVERTGRTLGDKMDHASWQDFVRRHGGTV